MTEKILKRFSYVRELEKGIDDLLGTVRERDARIAELERINVQPDQEPAPAIEAEHDDGDDGTRDGGATVIEAPKAKVSRIRRDDGRAAPVDVDLYIADQFAAAIQKTPVNLPGPFRFDLNPHTDMFIGVPSSERMFAPCIYLPLFVKACASAAQRIGLGIDRVTDTTIFINKADWAAYGERHMAEIAEWAKTKGHSARIESRNKAREAAEAEQAKKKEVAA
jgi:hypothetical protein